MTMRAYATERAERVADTLARRCEHILEAFLASRGDPLTAVDHLLVDYPEFVFGHCLRAAIIVRSDDSTNRSKLIDSVTAIEERCSDANHYARRHASAARAWLDRDQALAVERYGAIVVDFPNDVLALVVSHALDFRLGLRRMLRDRIAQVLPEWHAGLPGYASVLAMYAFGLEENGQYRRAEKMARRALKINPGHAGAIHVITHVMEMQGRFREGLEFLAKTESAWLNTSFSVHLAWHRALFHLDADDPQSALAVYDTQIAQSNIVSGLADASALLWRLQLRNIRTGDRWSRLADRWDTQSFADARPFYIAHAMMAFAAAGRSAGVERILSLLRDHETSGALATHSEDRLVAPLCTALLAFARRDYAGCVEWLGRVRHIAHQCGGSLAQCDLIQLTFVEAALRGKRATLARALVAERTAQKPASRLNRRLQLRLA